MTPFCLMLAALALLHLPGLRRWPGGATPSKKAAGAMGLVLLLPAGMHFTNPALFLAMIPPFLPAPAALVFASGIAEVLVSIGLLVPRTRRLAGGAAVLLFLALWPADIYVAVSGHYPPALSQSPLYHWLRVPFQLLYVGWGAWIALGHLPGLGLRQRLMAKLYDRIMAGYEAWAQPRKQRLFEDVRGTVLELGPGTGASFPYLDRSIRWIGIEPNAHMHARLKERAEHCGISDAEFWAVGAAGMEVEDESVDVVISTLVLCSVPDPATVLEDIRRVLKPGGRFLFLEHVAAERGTTLRSLQRLIRPVWQFCADGCCPERETGALIEAAGFSVLEMEFFRAPREAVPPFVSPHLTGVGVK